MSIYICPFIYVHDILTVFDQFINKAAAEPLEDLCQLPAFAQIRTERRLERIARALPPEDPAQEREWMTEKTLFLKTIVERATAPRATELAEQKDI